MFIEFAESLVNLHSVNRFVRTCVDYGSSDYPYCIRVVFLTKTEFLEECFVEECKRDERFEELKKMLLKGNN